MRIQIDPNVRVRGDQTVVAFRHVQGPTDESDLVHGADVTVFEPESGIEGFGRIAEVDLGRKLLVLTVDWDSLGPPDGSAKAKAPRPCAAV